MNLNHDLKEFTLSPKEEMLAVKNNFSFLSIGVLKETSFQENRVSLTPNSVLQLVKNGHKVLIESGAGENSKFSDSDYVLSGAIISNKENIFKSEYLIKIEPPSVEEIYSMSFNQVLLSAVQLNTRNFKYFNLLREKNITSLGFEFLEDDMGKIPIVRSMSEIAGKISSIIASEYLSNYKYGQGLMFGGVSGVISTNLVIIGAGNVAEYACKSSLALGAFVTVFDNSLSKLKKLQTNLSQHITTLTLQNNDLTNSLRNADVLIIALREDFVSSIISEEMVKKMKKGSVIIDISIDQGAFCETSKLTNHKEPTFVSHGVLHYCVPNIASRVSQTASVSISNILTAYIDKIAKQGGIDNAIVKYDFLRKGVYTYQSMITNLNICRKFKFDFKDLDLILSTR